MKVKKSSAIAIITVTMLFLSVLSASAAFYTCSIDFTGVDKAGNRYILLSDTAATPAFTSRYFLLVGAGAKEQLAVILTAMSLEKNVMVNLPATDQYTTISSVFLEN